MNEERKKSEGVDFGTALAFDSRAANSAATAIIDQLNHPPCKSALKKKTHLNKLKQ